MGLGYFAKSWDSLPGQTIAAHGFVVIQTDVPLPAGMSAKDLTFSINATSVTSGSAFVALITRLDGNSTSTSQKFDITLRNATNVQITTGAISVRVITHKLS